MSELRQTHLFLSSQNRSGGTNNQPEWDIQNSGVISSVYSWRLEAFVIPAAWYPVTSANNQIRWTDENSATHTSTLTVQDYNGTQLATEIAAQLNADTTDAFTYSASFDAQTRKITISSTGSSFSLLWADALSTARTLIGFGTSNVTGSASYVAPNSVQIGPKAVLIVGDNPHAESRLDSGPVRHDLLAMIPVSVDNGGIIAHQSFSHITRGNDASRLHSIRLELHDENDRLLDMNGVGWSVHLILFHK